MRSMVEGLFRGWGDCPSTVFQTVPLPTGFARREDWVGAQGHYPEEKLEQRQRRGDPQSGEARFGDHCSVGLLCFSPAASGGR